MAGMHQDGVILTVQKEARKFFPYGISTVCDSLSVDRIPIKTNGRLIDKSSVAAVKNSHDQVPIPVDFAPLEPLCRGTLIWHADPISAARKVLRCGNHIGFSGLPKIITERNHIDTAEISQHASMIATDTRH